MISTSDQMVRNWVAAMDERKIAEVETGWLLGIFPDNLC